MINKAQQFSGSNDIDNFFLSITNLSFVDWFNKKISSNGIWAGIRISNKANWQKVWSNVQLLFGKPNINLIEFLSICSIMTNETGGDFSPKTENVGSSGNPGIAYAFNKISGLKKSYNTLSTNKNALSLFNDPLYLNAHGSKPLSNLLKNTSDTRWSGELFPLGFSGNPTNETTISGKTNGFLIEIDAIKFRGRGYIQITGRANYKSLIGFITSYSGDDQVINSIKNSWKSHINIDDIATISTNQQWDDLFQKTNSIIANYACYVHSALPGRYKNYNIIDPNQSDVNLNKLINNIGLAISGSTTYANEFLQRVLLQIKELDSEPAPIISPTASTPQFAKKEESGRLENTGQDPNSQVNGNNITGSLSSITQVFAPTAKPGPISFDMSGNG